MFEVYEVSLELVAALRPLVPIVEAQDRDLADQMKRATSSIVLNLAEGQRSMKGNKGKHYAIAHGSANELKAAIQVAMAWGWIADGGHAYGLLDRVLAMLWRLTHPREQPATGQRTDQREQPATGQRTDQRVDQRTDQRVGE